VIPSTLQNVYDNTPADSTIQIMAGSFTDVLSVNADKTVWISGGYDNTYGNRSGLSIVTGPLVINSGKVIINSIGVR
jgi:hypothetical protein